MDVWKCVAHFTSMKWTDRLLWGFGGLALIALAVTSPDGLAWVFGAFFFVSTIGLRRWARTRNQKSNRRQLPG